MAVMASPLGSFYISRPNSNPLPIFLEFGFRFSSAADVAATYALLECFSHKSFETERLEPWTEIPSARTIGAILSLTPAKVLTHEIEA
jgi:hypothetical protein